MIQSVYSNVGSRASSHGRQASAYPEADSYCGENVITKKNLLKLDNVTKQQTDEDKKFQSGIIS